MGTDTQRRPVPVEDLVRLSDAQVMACPAMGSEISEDEERRIHHRLDELAEEMVGPMSHEDLLKLAIIYEVRHWRRLGRDIIHPSLLM